LYNEKPNIVFFFTDDQRFSAIHSLGIEKIKTPNLDNLVEKGISFSNTHIPCGTNVAVCMPSRAMLNTGRKLFHIKGAGETIPETHTTIGEALQKIGYMTFGSGKWHNGRRSYQRSFSDGDEIYFGGMADHWNVPSYHYDPSGKYDQTCVEVKEFRKSNKTSIRYCDHIHAGRHSSEIIADAGINFIEKYNGDRPFYIYLSFLAPHDPRTMPKKYLDMYDPEEIELPPNFMGGHPFNTGAIHVRDELLAGFPRTPEETRRHIAEYYAMISHLDSQIGRVVDKLKEKNLLENTIIIFASDNGLALGQHGLFGKQNCYEHSVRVPLIFFGPGLPKGIISKANAYLFDVFPTICGLLNIEVPASVEGKSLIKAMKDSSEMIRNVMYFAYNDNQRAVKKDNYKLIEYVLEGKHVMTQLFNLKEDPWEMSNLAHDPEYKEKLKEMRKNLIQLRDSWDDERTEWGQRFWSAVKFSS